MAAKMLWAIESGGQGLASLPSAFFSRWGWSYLGPPWSQSQALLCPKWASHGGDRASLAARPDGLWLRAQKPKTPG